MKVSILSIGTELCSGQITNKNAQWISHQLQKLGIITCAHVVVPDNKPLILEALRFCQSHSKIVFVTGGLGPTSDDFTREVLAEFCNSSLVFDAESWKMIERRLSERGIPVKEIQKQQCYFPKGSQILRNGHGTANGFIFSGNGLQFVVLPGPPREIEGLWQDELGPFLQQLTQGLDPMLTSSWDTIGLPESEVASLTESSIPIGVRSMIDIGYRVHLPYVEVKLTYLRSRLTQVQPTLSAVENSLQTSTVSRNGEDVAKMLTDQLRALPTVFFADSVSRGYLFKRLSDSLRPLIGENKASWGLTGETSRALCQLKLEPLTANSARAVFKLADEITSEEIDFPFASSQMLERNLQVVAERAIEFWQRCLKDNPKIHEAPAATDAPKTLS